MAESKRQNAAGKLPVATPILSQGQGSAPSPMISLETALVAAIGAKIRLTTISNSPPLEGVLFTACPVTNLLVVQTPPSANHIVPISSIQSFTILSLADQTTNNNSSSKIPFSSTAASVGSLPSSEALLRNANAAVERLKAEAAKKNKNVGKEAQDIFDAMIRMYANTRWDGDRMVVAESVVIDRPYKVENCTAVKGTAEASEGVKRIKKVLENERRKLAEKSKVAVPAVPAVPQVPVGGSRKGG